MYLFDTNVFLEILLDQKEANSCQKALEAVDEIHPGWASSFSLHAIAAILSRTPRHQDTLIRFLRDFSQNKFFFRYDTTTDEEAHIALLARKVALDFDDALQYYIAKKESLILVTLDRDFDKISDIQVISPKNLI